MRFQSYSPSSLLFPRYSWEAGSSAGYPLSLALSVTAGSTQPAALEHIPFWQKLWSAVVPVATVEGACGAKLDSLKMLRASGLKTPLSSWLSKSLWTPEGIRGMMHVEMAGMFYQTMEIGSILLITDYLNSKYTQATGRSRRETPLMHQLGMISLSAMMVANTVSQSELLKMGAQLRANENIPMTWGQVARELTTDPRLLSIWRASAFAQTIRNVPTYLSSIGGKHAITATLGMEKGPIATAATMGIVATTIVALYPLDLANTHLSRAIYQKQPICIRECYRRAWQDLYTGNIVQNHISRGIGFRIASKSLIPLMLATKDIVDGEMDRSIFDVFLHGVGGSVGAATVGALVGAFRGQAVRIAGMMGYHGLWVTALASIFMAGEKHPIEIAATPECNSIKPSCSSIDSQRNI